MWYAYALSPIDHHWEFLTPLNHLASEIGSAEALERVLHGSTVMYDGILSDVLSKDWALAKSLARNVGWEGDIKGRGPSVFWLPAENHFQYGFAFKQDNNGMTFVVSPVKLPWLEERADAMTDSFDMT